MAARIVLLLALFALASACAPECQIKFCDSTSTLSLGHTDRSLKPLCLAGAPLSNVQSGPTRVVLGNRQILFSAYSPNGLHQRFSSSFFKLYTDAGRSGVGHENVQSNQRSFLDGLCVVLPVLGTHGLSQRSSCVSYTVRVPRPPGTPTPTPDTKPTPSTPGPSRGAMFSELTFATGEANRSTIIRTSDARFGASHYRLEYDMSIVPSGVVALDDAASLIRSVSCSSDGSIKIVAKDTAHSRLGSLSEMYPVGAIIVVNREMYGACNLQTTTPAQQQAQRNNDGDPTSAKNRALVADGYLRIESVEGTPANAVIRGQPTAFPAMFERARIIITNLAPLPPARPTNSTTNSTLATTAVRQTGNAVDGGTTFGNSKTLQIGSGIFELDLKAQVTNRGGFRVLDATIDKSGINVRVTNVVDYTFTLEMLAKIRASISFEKSFEFISVPINGVDVGVKLEVQRKENSTKSVGIPLKFGSFFEVPIVVVAEVQLSKEITTPGKAVFNSGRKEVTYFVTGPYTDLQYGGTPVTNERFSVSFDPPRLTGGLFTGADSPNELSVSLFGGVQPKLAFYASFLEARISVDVGVELEVSGALPGGAPFGPNSGIGSSCDVCHLIEAKVNGVVQNFGLFVTSNLEFNDWIAYLISRVVPQTLFSLTLPNNPTLKNNLLNTCFFPLSAAPTGTEVCGQTCCDPSKPEVCSGTGGLTGDAVCTGSPTPDPRPSTPNITSSPTPNPSPDGSTASTYTDPHITTFDGLRYDCMATGEFILLKARSLELQGRFAGPSTRGSVMNGIVVTDGVDKIQVSVQTNSRGPVSTVAGSCPLTVFKNGKLGNSTASETTGAIQLTFPANNSILLSLASGTQFSFSTRPSSFFGCYFEAHKAFLPSSVSANRSVVGLLGSPNGNPEDDWMTRNGTVLPPPATGAESLYERAYDYCTKNWCITDPTESLFTYESGKNHSSFNKCSLPYSRVDVSSASAALRDLCGTDAACLIDGIVSGDVGEARNTLRVQADVDAARLGSSAISFFPQAISSSVSTNVRIEVDLSRLGSRGASAAVDSFNVYRLNSDTRAIDGPLLVTLRNTSSEGNLFSSILAVRSAIAGESFSYVAYPVISGREDRNSDLSITSLDALRSFSLTSGIGAVVSNLTSTTVPSIVNGTVIKVEYTWPLDQVDLDTSTQFLSNAIGALCTRSAPYMAFSGDDTSFGGKETVTIQLAEARAAGAWSSTVAVVIRTGWYLGAGNGPATLRVVLENGRGSAISEVLQVVLNPENSAPSRSASTCITGPTSAKVQIEVRSNVKMTLSA